MGEEFLFQNFRGEPKWLNGTVTPQTCCSFQNPGFKMYTTVHADPKERNVKHTIMMRDNNRYMVNGNV